MVTLKSQQIEALELEKMQFRQQHLHLQMQIKELQSQLELCQIENDVLKSEKNELIKEKKQWKQQSLFYKQCNRYKEIFKKLMDNPSCANDAEDFDALEGHDQIDDLDYKAALVAMNDIKRMMGGAKAGKGGSSPLLTEVNGDSTAELCGSSLLNLLNSDQNYEPRLPSASLLVPLRNSFSASSMSPSMSRSPSSSPSLSSSSTPSGSPPIPSSPKEFVDDGNSPVWQKCLDSRHLFVQNLTEGVCIKCGKYLTYKYTCEECGRISLCKRCLRSLNILC